MTRCPDVLVPSKEKVVQKTAVPTLDIIPETPDLNVHEKKIRLEPRREYILRDRLLPRLSSYEVIIFDNGSSWNQLIENALTASNICRVKSDSM